MCGIAGMVLTPERRNKAEWERLREDFATLLAQTQARGTDASGAFVLNRDEGAYFYRRPLAANQLVADKHFWALMDKIGRNTLAVVGHTRFATVGMAAENTNNHPIYDHPIIGVHNGHIFNHDALRHRYGATGEVDSAALFGMIRAHTNDKLTARVLERNLPRAQGDFAILVGDVEHSRLYAARRRKPLVLVREQHRGVLWVTSELRFVRETLGYEPKRWTALPEYTVAPLTAEHAAGDKVRYRFFNRSRVTMRGPKLDDAPLPRV